MKTDERNEVRLQLAKALAHEAHVNDVRKFSGEPYINHPRRVAETLEKAYPGEMDLQVLGWLHDVVEDHPEFFTRVSQEFPDLVHTLGALTRRPNETYHDFIMRIVAADRRAIIVKIADLQDNTRDLKEGEKRDKYRLAYTVLIYALLETIREDMSSLRDAVGEAVGIEGDSNG